MPETFVDSVVFCSRGLTKGELDVIFALTAATAPHTYGLFFCGFLAIIQQFSVTK